MQQSIEKHLEDWLDSSMEDITRADVEKRYLEIAETKRPTAKNVMGYLGSLYNLAMADELVSHNPVQVLSEKKIDRHVAPRTNYLKPPDLRSFFEALNELGNQQAARYFRMLLYMVIGSRSATSFGRSMWI